MRLNLIALSLSFVLVGCGSKSSETSPAAAEPAVSAPASAPATSQNRVQVLSVAVTGSGKVVEVTGTGFTAETVVNFFAETSSGNRNFGGVDESDRPLLSVRLVSPEKLTFDRPAEALAGPAYVMAVNPPFSPTDSSGDGPGGAFTLP